MGNADKIITRPCPTCGEDVTMAPYDIGSGPEMCCPHCETCWGIHGQPLDPFDPVKAFTGGERRMPNAGRVARQDAVLGQARQRVAAMSADDPEWDIDTAALAAEAEHGYWCREPIGGGEVCGKLGRPVPKPPTPDRTVLCEQHGKGWGRDLW